MFGDENASPKPLPRLVGRYVMANRIAAGGMATVHLGRLVGPVGFSRVVAIKRLHPTFSRDPEFVAMFLDEARIAARIRHPNVIQTLDVVATEGELFLVMDYVEGESLARLWRLTIDTTGRPPPPRISAGVVCGVLHGLHAAHEAKGESGEVLGVVHRDVSPQNILVGVDGVPRVLDFGVAKAVGRLHTTQSGQLKGKLPYMAPEQIRLGPLSRATDVYAASVVLWEMLAGRRLHDGESAEIIARIFAGIATPPSLDAKSLRGTQTPEELDRIVLRGLHLEPASRFETARDMALAIERAVGIASASEISEWVTSTAGPKLTQRAALVSLLETRKDVPEEVDQGLDASEAAAIDAALPATRVAVDIAFEPTRSLDTETRPYSTGAKAKRQRVVGGAVAACVIGVAIASAVAWGQPGPGLEAVAALGPAIRRVEAAIPSASAKAPAPMAEQGGDEAAAESSAAPSARRRPGGRASTKPPPPPAAPPAAATRPDPCNPPYVVDAQGVKVIKKECAR